LPAFELDLDLEPRSAIPALPPPLATRASMSLRRGACVRGSSGGPGGVTAGSGLRSVATRGCVGMARGSDGCAGELAAVRL